MALAVLFQTLVIPAYVQREAGVPLKPLKVEDFPGLRKLTVFPPSIKKKKLFHRLGVVW